MFGLILDIVLTTKELTMKNVTCIIAMLLAVNLMMAQSQNPAVILISSSSTPEYIGEMKESLKNHGLYLNVEREVWKDKETLAEFAFTLVNTNNKTPKSFNFKYNDLNEHQILLIYPSGENNYTEVMADVSYMKSDILPLVVTKEIKRRKPVLHRSYGKSGAPYRQSIVLTDLVRLESTMANTVHMFKAIKADQAIGKSISGMTYTYNGAYIEDPAGINMKDMSSDVLIETLEDNSKIINIWSEEPLNQLISTAIVGQR